MVGVGSHDGSVSVWIPCHGTKHWEMAFKIASHDSSVPVEALFSPCGGFLEVVKGGYNCFKRNGTSPRCMRRAKHENQTI